ncbi:hypothetical protein TNCV_4095371 [Trichonephila clavipes]|uniref:Uncharacterized protein n=1 Tax=Trichonephila clavipes TaxID=2585209 RepID=A0A8X6S581_TRICX|nr:hypothetical protein TNCV_4095371 [Trichonephila clavipes]
MTYLSLCSRRNITATPAKFRSSLGQPCVEGFTNVVFKRDHVNMSTGRVINEELFSLRMSPGLASKAIVGVFSFADNLELVFLHDTCVKEMHMDKAVSVFGVISLWVDTHHHVSPLGRVDAQSA